MPRFFGAHVSASGGLHNALVNGRDLGVNTIQLHPSPPQRWNTKPFAPGLEEQFLQLRESSGVEKVFFHAIYLINLATPDSSQFHLSKSSLLHFLDLSHRIAGNGVVFHSGSLKNEPDEAKGLRRVAEGINWVMEHYEGTPPLLIEVAAGAGAVIGDRLEELAEIYRHVEDKDRVGFGLDTQHLWASGYNLREDLPGFVASVGEILSFEKVQLIHLNDSMTECASRRDRHENLGQGLIGEEALRAFLMHPAFEKIPFVLETPALKSIESAKAEVEHLRAWVKDGGPAFE